MNSLYIHIPFCRKKCLYCDFYSINYTKDITSYYIDILCRQIKALDDRFDTVYVGGGTPTVLDEKLLKKLLKSLKKIVNSAYEFSIEANPESLDKEKIKLFSDMGVNRLSIGVQSFYDDKLEKLCRIHSAKQAKGAVLQASQLGFKNISIDLIFGVWQENIKNWKKELKTAVNLPIKHISVYSLTYEKNTPLFKKTQRKEISPLGDNKVAQMFNYAMDYLPRAGFLQYEVSNFAKREYSCRHNENYWKNNSYVGLGPSAVSYRENVRERNIANIKKYIEKVDKGESPIIFRERLSSLRRAKETASLKIRTNDGIEFDWFKAKTGFDFLNLEKDTMDRLVGDGLIEYKQNRGKDIGIQLTKKGILFCDTVSASFL